MADEEPEDEQALREMRAADERRYRSETGAVPPPNQPAVAALDEASACAEGARAGRMGAVTR